MTSRAGHLVPTARAATLNGAGRTTCHEPRQAGVFCRSPALVALVRTVGRPRRSAVKVGRKLEKKAHSGVHRWHTPAALPIPHCGRQHDHGCKEPVRQARHRRRATVLRFPRYISWFVPTARSRLASGPSRPTDTQVATHDRPVTAGVSASTGTDTSVISSLPHPSDFISAYPRTSSARTPL